MFKKSLAWLLTTALLLSTVAGLGVLTFAGNESLTYEVIDFTTGAVAGTPSNSELFAVSGNALMEDGTVKPCTYNGASAVHYVRGGNADHVWANVTFTQNTINQKF